MNQPISDNDALWRVRNGDTGSYEVLVARYYRRLHRVARRVLRTEEDAEDAVQSAHLLALVHIHQCAGGSSYFNWMRSIVLNQARQQIRKRKRLVNIGIAYPGWLAAPERNPEEQAIDGDVQQTLESAVESLPPVCRAVVRLRSMEDLPTTETGERLGLTDACVKSRLFRAKHVLRSRLMHVIQGAHQSRPPGFQVPPPNDSLRRFTGNC